MNSVFARRQLEKHGWTDGDGLGRRKNGMSQPIKVNLKMDKTGMGHDPGKEFTDHWWMRAFNDAAKNIKKADEPQQSEESKRKAETSAKRKTFYKGFVKGSTLTNGCETKDSDQSNDEDEEDEEKAKASIPTLDDLHKFCDGATGHRAARFGIKMKGKLSRVAAHDKEFEEQSKIDPGILYVKKGKHKSIAKVSSNNTQAMDEDMEMSPNSSDKYQFTERESHQADEAFLEPMILSETEKKKKKKKRKGERGDKELESAVEKTACSLAAESELYEEIGKKKKRKRDNLVEEAAMNNLNSNREIDDRNLNSDIPDEPVSQEQPESKKKKKRKTGTLVEEAAMNNTNNSDSTCNGNIEIDDGNLQRNIPDEPVSQEQPGTKKKKKRKTNTLAEEVALSASDSTDNNNRKIDDGNLKSDIPDEPESQEQPGTKKKKKRKTNTVAEEVALSSTSDSTDNNNRKIDDGNVKSDVHDEPESQEQPGTKKKKKRKTNILAEEVALNVSADNGKIDDGNLQSTIADEPESQEQPGNKKKKKRKTKTLVEEVALNISDSTDNRKIDDGNLKSDIADEPESQEQPGTKKKKKKVKDQEEVLPITNGDVDKDSLRKEKRKKEKKRSSSKEIINTLNKNKTNLIEDVQMSDEVNGSGNEKLHDVETPRKKKKKSQDSNLNVEDLSVSNDSPLISSKRKQSKKHISEMDVLEHGISEETKEKKKKNKDCL